MNKKVKSLIAIIILVVLVILLSVLLFKTNILSKKATKLNKTDDIEIVPTMRDEITQDSSWCGTFQLVWNDMKNEVVKKEVVFNPQEVMADNLNKEEFTQDMISDEYYYKIYGLKTLELKEQIEKGIKGKFNQESDVINDLDWSEEGIDNPNNPYVRKYLFYAMLYRNFEFLKEFDKLENGKFADKYDNIEYFGIDKNTKDSVGNQIDVLYYNSKDDFAIKLETKKEDEVILCKNPQGNTFNEIYNNILTQKNEYKGSRRIQEDELLKVPNIKLNEKNEFKEIQDKPFSFSNGDIYTIEKAIQTIEFELDREGGKIKSEAGMMANYESAMMIPEEIREFFIDDTFAIFLIEEDKDTPYFAGKIDDITKFQ